LLGQTGQSISIPELLQFDARRSQLRLDEAEPDSWFLLIVGAKLDLSGRCCQDGLTIVSFRHVLREIKRGNSPSNYRELFPRGQKEQGSPCENSTKKNKWCTRTKQTKMEGCTNRVYVQQNLIIHLQISK
jgi:hypothetical protein